MNRKKVENVANTHGLTLSNKPVEIGYSLFVLNDDGIAFEWVVLALCKAVGCTQAVARSLAGQIHGNGKAKIYEGTRSECQDVAGRLAMFPQLDLSRYGYPPKPLKIEIVQGNVTNEQTLQLQAAR